MFNQTTLVNEERPQLQECYSPTLKMTRHQSWVTGESVTRG